MAVLKRVVSYVWIRTEAEKAAELAQGIGVGASGRIVIDTLDWWPPFPGTYESEGRTFIKLGEGFEDCRQPDLERLECGHEQPPRVFWKRNYYNRRRRCDVCAREVRSHGL